MNFKDSMKESVKYACTPPTPPGKEPIVLNKQGSRDVIIRTYTGSQDSATAQFQTDSAKMAAQGYFPTSQSWAPGSYGCGSFILALLLCVIVVGVLVFIYMLLVKPAGTLTVTYERQVKEILITEEKTCPKCAEQVKYAAKICRYCGHDFTYDETEND